MFPIYQTAEKRLTQINQRWRLFIPTVVSEHQVKYHWRVKDGDLLDLPLFGFINNQMGGRDAMPGITGGEN